MSVSDVNGTDHMLSHMARFLVIVHGMAVVQVCPCSLATEANAAESFTLLLSSQGQADIEGQRDVFCVQFSTGSINPYKPGESSPVVV